MSVSKVVSLRSCYSDHLAVNEYAPSFPPTSIDYVPYPWLGDNGNGSEQDGQDQNSLSYLMMSKFESPPRPVGMPYTGPWTDEGNRKASFCTSERLFWGWLHPLMRKLSRAMTPIPEKPYLENTGIPPDRPWHFQPMWHIGDSDAPDDDYKWVASDQTTWKATTPTKSSFSTAEDPNNEKDREIAKESSMLMSQLHSAQSNSS